MMEIRGRRRKQLLDDLKKCEDTENGTIKHWIALCGELEWKKSMVLS